MGPGERPQLAAGGRGSGRVHANAASGSLAQLVTLNLEELLNPAGQLPVEASDVEVIVDVGARSTEPSEISLPGLLRRRPRGALRQQRSQPRHSRLVQHHFLQGPRLLPSILAPERQQAVRAQLFDCSWQKMALAKVGHRSPRCKILKMSDASSWMARHCVSSI